MSTDHRGRFDPVVAGALAHYQFEALHPFHDGNGRLGRLLIVVQLHHSGLLSEPTLSVSPWFEGHRADYFGCLMGVSTQGDGDTWVSFFAQGLQASADQTLRRMEQLAHVQADLKQQVAASPLRAGSARQLVDFAVGQPTFTVREAASALGLSYGRTNKLVDSLVDSESSPTGVKPSTTDASRPPASSTSYSDRIPPSSQPDRAELLLSTMTEKRTPRMDVRPGGAKGIRTPGLLIANETRYQLRHSPMLETAPVILAPRSRGITTRLGSLADGAAQRVVVLADRLLVDGGIRRVVGSRDQRRRGHDRCRQVDGANRAWQ